jgi:hypothetical protein
MHFYLAENKANLRVSSFKFEVSSRRSSASIPPTSNLPLCGERLPASLQTCRTKPIRIRR